MCVRYTLMDETQYRGDLTVEALPSPADRVSQTM